MAVSAGGNNVFAGAFQELAGGPNFDGSTSPNKGVVVAQGSDTSALASNNPAAVTTSDAKSAEIKSTVSPVPTLGAQVEQMGSRSAEAPALSADTRTPFHPIEALKSVFHKVSPALVCFGAGAFIGFAIAGPPGILIGGLAFAAFAILGML